VYALQGAFWKWERKRRRWTGQDRAIGGMTLRIGMDTATEAQNIPKHFLFVVFWLFVQHGVVIVQASKIRLEREQGRFVLLVVIASSRCKSSYDQEHHYTVVILNGQSIASTTLNSPRAWRLCYTPPVTTSGMYAKQRTRADVESGYT